MILTGSPASAQAPAKKPNILVIFGDDVGVSNISAYSGGLMGYETLIKNVDRASRASNSAEVQRNADGSVDLYFGPKAPAGKASNWVPTDPARQFELMLRLYAPTKAFFDEQWKLADVEKVK